MNRDLDGCERLYWIANQCSPNNVTAVCELSGPLDEARLQAAVVNLTQLHPLLQMRVLADTDGRDPRFVRHATPPLAIRRLLLSEGDLADHLDALLEEELNRPIDAGQGLARVVYADNGVRALLAFTAVHIIADASAVMVALSDLLTSYGGEPTRAPEPLRPPYAALLPPALRVGAALPALVPAQLSALAARPVRLSPERAVPLSERQNRVLRRTLSPMLVADLKQACARHDVSLHALLVAALGLSLGEELGLRERARACVTIGSPVSLRAALEPAIGQELGSYVATVPCHLEVGREQTLWRLSQAARRDLSRRRARREPFALLDVTRALAPASVKESAATLKLAESAGPGNVCLSNIGAFAFPEHAGGIAVRRVLWSASLSFSGYFLCAAVTTGQGLSLTFAYVDEVVSEARARRLVDGMLTRLCGVSATALAEEGVA